MDLPPGHLEQLRDELARAVAESSLTQRARELSLSRSALRALLGGAVPSARTADRLVLWYGERLLRRARLGAQREAALRMLLADLSPSAAERARLRIVEVLEDELEARPVGGDELVAQLNAELARRQVPDEVRFGDGVLRYWRPTAMAPAWDESLALEGAAARRYAEVAGMVIRWGRARFTLAMGE
jgi:hypothetical protein